MHIQDNDADRCCEARGVRRFFGTLLVIFAVDVIATALTLAAA